MHDGIALFNGKSAHKKIMTFVSRFFYGCSAILLGLFTFFAPLKFSVPYTYNIDPSVPQDFLDFLFMPWPVEWGVFLLIVSTLLSLLSRWRSNTFSFQIIALDGWVLLWMFWMVFIFVAHGMQFVGFPSCLLFFGYGLYYFLLRSLDPKTRAVLWGLNMMAFTLIVLYGFYQQYEGLEETLKNLNQIKTTEATNPQVLARLQGKKIFSTFVYSNTLAGYLILWIPMLAFFWGDFSRRRSLVRGGMFGLGIFFYILLGMMEKFSWAWCYALHGLTLPISAFYLLLLTRSKGALLSLILSSLVVGFFWMFHRSWKAACIFLFLVLFLVCGFLTPLKQKLEASWKVRMEYNQASWTMIQTHPWIGTGPGTYGTNYMHHKLPQAEEVQLAHNNFLQMASEYGVFALLLFLGIWGSVLKNFLRLPWNALKIGMLWVWGAAFLHQGMDFDWFVPGLGFFTIFFMSECASNEAIKKFKWEIPKSLMGFAFGFLLLLLFPTTRLCQALDWQQKALLRLETGNSREAALCFQNALSIYPYSAQAWIRLAEVFFLAGDFERAENAYRKSLELIPDHAMTWWKLTICMIHHDQKNNQFRTQEVLTAFQNAMHYYPTNPAIRKHCEHYQNALLSKINSETNRISNHSRG
jgi:tetratricopeptide (TPR) repeat protein